MARMVFGQWASDSDESDPRRRLQVHHARSLEDPKMTRCGRAVALRMYVTTQTHAGPYRRLIIDCQQCLKHVEGAN